MPIIAQKAELTLPDKSEYIATIHGNKPKCMDVFKNKYDCDPIFKKLCKTHAKAAINTFINDVKLDIHKLSEKLKKLKTRNIIFCVNTDNFIMIDLMIQYFK